MPEKFAQSSGISGRDQAFFQTNSMTLYLQSICQKATLFVFLRIDSLYFTVTRNSSVRRYRRLRYPFSKRQTLDSSKLADDNFKFDKNDRKIHKRIENTVGK